jgi:hypothetical protein
MPAAYNCRDQRTMSVTLDSSAEIANFARAQLSPS